MYYNPPKDLSKVSRPLVVGDYWQLISQIALDERLFGLIRGTHFPWVDAENQFQAPWLESPERFARFAEHIAQWPEDFLGYYAMPAEEFFKMQYQIGVSSMTCLRFRRQVRSTPIDLSELRVGMEFFKASMPIVYRIVRIEGDSIYSVAVNGNLPDDMANIHQLVFGSEEHWNSKLSVQEFRADYFFKDLDPDYEFAFGTFREDQYVETGADRSML